MTSELVIMAMAILLDIGGDTAVIASEAVKMPLKECLVEAAQINVDPNNDYIMSCAPFPEMVGES